MLAKDKRISREDFDVVYKKGSNVKADIGYAKWLKNNEKKQVACVVSKSEVKKSIDRTRIRRRGYAVAAYFFADIPDGVRIIWFLPRSVQDTDYESLQNSFQDIVDHITEAV